MVLEILDPGMQAKEFLRVFPPLESLLLPFLTPCSTVGLLNYIVTAGGREHPLVVDINEARDLSDRGRATPQLVGTDRVWDIIFAK